MPAPALAVDHREPNASPDEVVDLAIGLLPVLEEMGDVRPPEVEDTCGAALGMGTEVK